MVVAFALGLQTSAVNSFRRCRPSFDHYWAKIVLRTTTLSTSSPNRQGPKEDVDPTDPMSHRAVGADDPRSTNALCWFAIGLCWLAIGDCIFVFSFSFSFSLYLPISPNFSAPIGDWEPSRDQNRHIREKLSKIVSNVVIRCSLKRFFFCLFKTRHCFGPGPVKLSLALSLS